MKKLFLLIALGGVMPAFQSRVLAQEAPTFAAVPTATAPFKWRLRLKAGQKWITTTETSTQNSQQMPTMPDTKAGALPTMDNVSKSRTVIEQNVLSNDDEGARVEMIYREITQDTRMTQGDKVIYDSKTAPETLGKLTDLFKALEGTCISYRLSNQGQVSDVQGVEAYLERFKAALDTATQTTPGLSKFSAQVGAFLSPEAIKNSLGDLYRTLPTTPIALGESWKYNFTKPVMGTTLTQNGQNTLTSRQNEVVTIAQSGEFSTDGGAQIKIPLPTMGDDKAPAPISQLDLGGTLNGEITIDERSGLILRSHATQNLEGELVMSGAMGRGSRMSIPMKMTVEMESTTQEIKSAP